MPKLRQENRFDVKQFIINQTSYVHSFFCKAVLSEQQQADKNPALTDEQEQLFKAYNTNDMLFLKQCDSIFQQYDTTDEILRHLDEALLEWRKFFDEGDFKLSADVNFDVINNRIKSLMYDFLEEQEPALEGLFYNGSAYLMEADQKLDNAVEGIVKKLGISSADMNKRVETVRKLFAQKREKYLSAAIIKQYGLSKAESEDDEGYASRIKLKYNTLSENKQLILLGKLTQVFLDEHQKDLDPLGVFCMRMSTAIRLFDTDDVKASEIAFKKRVEAAVDVCVAHYQKTVDPSVLDYIKAAALALVGTLIGILTFPALVSSTYREQLSITFFSGFSTKVVDTPECDIIRDEMKACDL